VTATLTVERKPLLAALAAVTPAVGRQKKMPVLAGVRISADTDGVFTVEATNLDLTLRAPLSGQLKGRSAAVVINAKRLRTAVLRGLPAGPVKITLDPKRPRLSSRKTTIWFDGLPAEGWPWPPVFTGQILTLTADDIATIRRVSVAACDDWARPILHAVCVADGFAVATDSYRLLAARISATPPKPVLLPLEAVKALPAEGCDLAVGDTDCAWGDEHSGGRARLVAGDYPNWSPLMPSEIAAPLVIERAPFLAAVLRAEAVLATLGRYHATPLRLTKVAGGFALNAQHVNEDVFAEELSFDGPGAESIALNPRFLVETLRSIPGDRVRLSIRDPLKPVLLTPDADGDDYRALVMPVRTPEGYWVRRAS
jgi:DNA polymerase III subunit beta